MIRMIHTKIKFIENTNHNKIKKEEVLPSMALNKRMMSFTKNNKSNPRQREPLDS